MYTLISYLHGVAIEGVIVSRTRNRMRVVAAGMPDALELRRTGLNWLTEDGEEVQFEFLAVDFPARAVVRSPAFFVHNASSAAS